MIFFIHADEVILILQKITQLELTSNLFKYALIASILITFVLFIMLQNKKVLEINILEEALLLILFLVIFSNATLLWSFSIYFIVWHSLPSLKDQLLLLYGNVNRRSILNYLKSSFIYWFIAIIGIILLIYIFSENDYDFYTFSAALLFSITFPHIIVISKIYK
jgi:Brp/Blh family beta-carotene 15,15'-monooxygenase